jgi:hypothetical protein
MPKPMSSNGATTATVLDEVFIRSPDMLTDGLEGRPDALRLLACVLVCFALYSDSFRMDQAAIAHVVDA